MSRETPQTGIGGGAAATKALALGVLLLVSLALSPAVLAGARWHAALHPSIQVLPSHDPIYIEGNLSFTPANGVVSGHGTPGDPFVIAGWQIDTSTGNAIDVRNTSAFFVVQDIAVVNSHGAPPFNYTTHFVNVTHAEVEYVNVSNGSQGFWISHSADVTLTHMNQSSVSGMDLWLEYSDNVTISDSLFSGTGLNAWTTENLTIASNHLTGAYKGLIVRDSTHTIVDANVIDQGEIRGNYTWNATISNNRIGRGWILLGYAPSYNATVVGNTLGGVGYGIDAWSTPGVIIAANNVSAAGEFAIALSGAPGATVVGNRLSDSHVGILVQLTANASIFHNDIVNNSIQAEVISSTHTSWNSSYPVGGNFWSDYTGVDRCSGALQDNCTGPDGIGDTPYTIDSSNLDHYPLMASVGNDTTPPVVAIMSPSEGASFTSSPISVSGTAYDTGGSGLRDVKVRVNGGSWSPANGFATWTASVTLDPGPNLIEAQARDWAGNAASAEVNVTYSSPPSSNTPPVANFSWTPMTGNTSTVFMFTSTASDSQDSPAALQVRWDWESDGAWDTSWSTAATATHTFATAGTYNVTLEVRDTGGLTSSKTYALVVTSSPVPPPAPLLATIGATPLAGPMPLTVTFTSAVSGGAAPYAYDWHFGDGSTSPSANATHAYQTTGNFTASLTVRDSGGHEAVSNVLWVNVTVAGCPDCIPPPSLTPLIAFGAIVGIGAIVAVVAVFYAFRVRKPGPPG